MDYTKLAKKMLKIIESGLTEEHVTLDDIIYWLENEDEDVIVANAPSELASMFMEQF